jgi:hypothetical protein
LLQNPSADLQSHPKSQEAASVQVLELTDGVPQPGSLLAVAPGIVALFRGKRINDALVYLRVVCRHMYQLFFD